RYVRHDTIENGRYLVRTDGKVTSRYRTKTPMYVMEFLSRNPGFLAYPLTDESKRWLVLHLDQTGPSQAFTGRCGIIGPETGVTSKIEFWEAAAGAPARFLRLSPAGHHALVAVGHD